MQPFQGLDELEDLEKTFWFFTKSVSEVNILFGEIRTFVVLRTESNVDTYTKNKVCIRAIMDWDATHFIDVGTFYPTTVL